jgi:hypothetical protein
MERSSLGGRATWARNAATGRAALLREDILQQAFDVGNSICSVVCLKPQACRGFQRAFVRVEVQSVAALVRERPCAPATAHGGNDNGEQFVVGARSRPGRLGGYSLHAMQAGCSQRLPEHGGSYRPGTGGWPRPAYLEKISGDGQNGDQAAPPAWRIESCRYSPKGRSTERIASSARRSHASSPSPELRPLDNHRSASSL